MASDLHAEKLRQFPSVNAWDRSQTSLTIMSSPGRAESKSQNSPL